MRRAAPSVPAPACAQGSRGFVGAARWGKPLLNELPMWNHGEIFMLKNKTNNKPNHVSSVEESERQGPFDVLQCARQWPDSGCWLRRPLPSAPGPPGWCVCSSYVSSFLCHGGPYPTWGASEPLLKPLQEHFPLRKHLLTLPPHGHLAASPLCSPPSLRPVLTLLACRRPRHVRRLSEGRGQRHSRASSLIHLRVLSILPGAWHLGVISSCW